MFISKEAYFLLSIPELKAEFFSWSQFPKTTPLLRGWAHRCLPPELGRGPGFSAFPGCFFPRLPRPSLSSGSIHRGAWLPPGQVACPGPGCHRGWWGWPQSGHFLLSCLFLRATPDPSPAPTLSLLPRPFTETPVLPARWAEGLGASAVPKASFFSPPTSLRPRRHPSFLHFPASLPPSVSSLTPPSSVQASSVPRGT